MITTKDIDFLTELNKYLMLIDTCKIVYKRKRMAFVDLTIATTTIAIVTVLYFDVSNYWYLLAGAIIFFSGIFIRKNHEKVKALDALSDSAYNICSIDTITAMYEVVKVKYMR